MSTNDDDQTFTHLLQSLEPNQKSCQKQDLDKGIDPAVCLSVQGNGTFSDLSTLNDASNSSLPWLWRAGSNSSINCYSYHRSHHHPPPSRLSLSLLPWSSKAAKTGAREEAILVTGGSQVIIMHCLHSHQHDYHSFQSYQPKNVVDFQYHDHLQIGVQCLHYCHCHRRHNCQQNDNCRAGQRICRLLVPVNWFSPAARWTLTNILTTNFTTIFTTNLTSSWSHVLFWLCWSQVC